MSAKSYVSFLMGARNDEMVAEICRLDRVENISTKVNKVPGQFVTIIDVHKSDNIKVDQRSVLPTSLLFLRC